MPTCAPIAGGQAARAAARHLLGEDGVVQVVAALAAVLLGVLQAEEADARQPAEDLVGEPARLLPLGGVRAQLLGDEAPDRLAQRLVLVGEGRVGGHSPATVLHAGIARVIVCRWPAPSRRAARSTPSSTRSRRTTWTTRSRSCASCRLSEAPVFYAPSIDYYVVTRYEDIEAIFLDHETFSAAAAQLPLAALSPQAARVAAGRRPPPGAVDGQPRPARAHARAPPHRARVHAAARGLDGGHDPRHGERPARRGRPGRALRPRRVADLPAAGDDRLHPHRRAARGLRAAQALVRLPRRADLRAHAARGAGRARGEHRRLPPLPARAGRRARRAAHRRPHERADRHPRRGPRGAHARRDRLDLLLAELRRPRDDELPDRQRHAAPARGPRALGARRRRPGRDPGRRGGDAALRSVGLRLAARDDPAHDRRRRRPARGREALPVAGGGGARPVGLPRARTPSTSTARTPAATSPSAAASTSASARHWASSKPSWPSRSSRAGGRSWRWSTVRSSRSPPTSRSAGPRRCGWWRRHSRPRAPRALRCA